MGECIILIAFMINPPSITWSYTSGSNYIVASPSVADIDPSSPGSEVIFATAVQSPHLFCISSTGNLLWSQTISTNNGPWSSSPVIARLGAPGDPAIIVGTPYGQNVACVNYDGSIRWQFSLPAACWSSPQVANIDTVGTPEILVGCENGLLYCLNADGTQKWTFACGEPIYGESPAIANIDEVGTPEVLITTMDTLYCVDSNGGLIWKSRLPQASSSQTGGYGVSPSIADVDGDGDAEIVIGDICFEANGDLRWDYGLGNYSTSAIADLDYDGMPEIVTWCYNNSLIYVFRDNGAGNPPQVVWTAQAVDASGTWNTTPIIANIMGDSAREVIWQATGYLRIYDGNTGAVICENTQLTTNTCSEHGATAADVDNDGIIEIVAIYQRHGVALLEDDANWTHCDKNRFSGHLYHITELNSDLSVPNNEQCSWKTHNTWLTQVCETPPGIEENKKLENGRMEIYPTPFVDKVIIRYSVPHLSFVKIKVYDITGQIIKTLVNSSKEKGAYSVIWDRKDSIGNIVRAGIYFSVFKCGGIKKTQKLVIVSH